MPQVLVWWFISSKILKALLHCLLASFGNLILYERHSALYMKSVCSFFLYIFQKFLVSFYFLCSTISLWYVYACILSLIVLGIHYVSSMLWNFFSDKWSGFFLLFLWFLLPVSHYLNFLLFSVLEKAFIISLNSLYLPVFLILFHMS